MRERRDMMQVSAIAVGTGTSKLTVCLGRRRMTKGGGAGQILEGNPFATGAAGRHTRASVF